MRASGLEGRASVDPRAHPRPVGHFRHATPDDARGTAFETLVILSGRDEFSHTWLKGDLPNSAARGSNSVDLRNGRRLHVPAVLLMNADGFNVWLPWCAVVIRLTIVYNTRPNSVDIWCRDMKIIKVVVTLRPCLHSSSSSLSPRKMFCIPINYNIDSFTERFYLFEITNMSQC